MSDFPLNKGIVDSPPLPAGAQLIFTQARAMGRTGVVPAHTTLFWEAFGPMDGAAMCRAMDTLIRTRDYLHLKIENRDGTGVLQPASPVPAQVETMDPGNLAEEMSAWSTRPPRSSKEPACTLRLINLGREHFCIGLSGPHDLLDIWTIDQTLSSLARLYNGYLDNQPAPLAQAPGFMEYSAWYDDLVNSDQLKDSRAFWQDLLEGTAQVFKRPPDPDTSCHPMTAVQSALPLSPDICQAFETKARAAGVSVFEGYFTLFNLALARITGQGSLLSAFVVSLRRTPGIGNVEGCLLNRFYIPVQLAEDTDFASAAGQVSKTLTSAKAHCLWPVWKEIDPKGTGYPGLFFHYVPPNKGQMPGFTNLSVSPFTLVTPKYWPHPLAFQVMRNTDQPMLGAIGQAGFCSQAWLGGLQRIFADIMATV